MFICLQSLKAYPLVFLLYFDISSFGEWWHSNIANHVNLDLLLSNSLIKQATWFFSVSKVWRLSPHCFIQLYFDISSFGEWWYSSSLTLYCVQSLKAVKPGKHKVHNNFWYSFHSSWISFILNRCMYLLAKYYL